MSKSDPTPTEIARLQDAGDWLQRLNQPHDQALVDRWMQWCEADAMNLPAFEQMQRIWLAFSGTKAKTLHPSALADRPKHRLRPIALAASIVILIATAGWFAVNYSNDRLLETAVGEQRRIPLADGSRLDLAPGSLVSTHFTLTRREVRLERGQAFFEVAHSAVRPFTVHAGNLTVTAAGTAFDVQISTSSSAVTVGEGSVTVAQGTPGIGDVRAGAGQRVTFSPSARGLSVVNVNPKVAGAWRGGTLLFMGEPLEDVINAINRYTSPPIVVAPAFQQARFTGTVSPLNIREWLNALELIYDVKVVDQGSNRVLIRSRAENIGKR
jgi:transmembrane sensor